MNEELQKFIEWIPQNIEEMKDKTPDEIVEILNNLGQSNDGKKMIETWMSKFKDSTSMFKDGGKMEALVNVFKCGGKPKCKSKSKCGSKYECGGKCKIRKGADGLDTDYEENEPAGGIEETEPKFNRRDFRNAKRFARNVLGMDRAAARKFGRENFGNYLNNYMQDNIARNIDAINILDKLNYLNRQTPTIDTNVNFYEFDTPIDAQPVTVDAQPVRVSPAFDIEDAVQRTIRGEYGNGLARRNALGENYYAVQKRINEIMRNRNKSSIPIFSTVIGQG